MNWNKYYKKRSDTRDVSMGIRLCGLLGLGLLQTLGLFKFGFYPFFFFGGGGGGSFVYSSFLVNESFIANILVCV